MIKPKYEIGYRFKDSRDFEFEILQKQYNGSIVLYTVINHNTGIISLCLEKDIDYLVGGKNAKKPRKK